MHAREDINGDSYTVIDYYKEYVEEDGVIVEDIRGRYFNGLSWIYSKTNRSQGFLFAEFPRLHSKVSIF